MITLFKLIFAILSTHVLKDEEQIMINRLKARFHLEKLLKK